MCLAVVQEIMYQNVVKKMKKLHIIKIKEAYTHQHTMNKNMKIFLLPKLLHKNQSYFHSVPYVQLTQMFTIWTIAFMISLSYAIYFQTTEVEIHILFLYWNIFFHQTRVLLQIRLCYITFTPLTLSISINSRYNTMYQTNLWIVSSRWIHGCMLKRLKFTVTVKLFS